MPIYAYRCESCGHAKDVLQKVSDPVLITCPACHAQSFKKQVTAAGFQLKGSGWYVTDFRGGNGNGAAKGTPAEGTAGPGEVAPPEGKSDGKGEGKSEASSSTASSSAADGGGGCGTSCACH